MIESGGVRMLEIIGAVISGICFAVCLMISVMQFKKKGFPLNNAYIWASKQERRKMNRKPHYKQSGIVFALCSLMFFCITLECIFATRWLWICVVVIIIVLIVYAIISSVKNEIFTK